MKNAKYLNLLTICFAFVLLLCSLSGCALNRDSDHKIGGLGETLENDKTSENTSILDDDENIELSDELSYTFEFLNAENNEWESVEETEISVFGTDEYEPGYKKYVYFRIKNTSKIGFDWNVDFEDCPGDLKLGEVIYVFTNFGEDVLVEYPNRSDEVEGYWARGTLKSLLTNDGPFYSSELSSGETAYFGILLEMNPNVGNEYHGLELENITLNLTVTEQLLYATSQDDNESNEFSIAVNNDVSMVESLLPGDLLDMNTSVRNTSSYKQYVRVTVTVSDAAAFRQDMGTDWSAESLFINPSWEENSTMVLDSVTVRDDCAVLVLYVNKLIASGESIVLFEGVSMPAELTANTVGTTSLKDGFTIKVFAEAVFTANVSINDAKAAFEYAASKQK